MIESTIYDDGYGYEPGDWYEGADIDEVQALMRSEYSGDHALDGRDDPFDDDLWAQR